MGQIQSKCVDFVKVKELEKKIQELHDGAVKKIDDSYKRHVRGGGSCINDDRLQLFLHQIKNKMLLVAVVGEGSSGKSTLINAFLRDKILPKGIGKVTGVRVFIGHDPNVHKDPCEGSGHCEKCPYLVRGIGKHDHDVLCHGVEDIKSKIAEKNKMNKNKKDPLVLYTYIPVFDSLSSSTDCTPYLVDSPGVEVINDDVQSYYSILSAMVYVESYQRLLQNEENVKKELGCKLKDASLFFAVSQFDKYYTSSADEPNPDEEETKAIVESDIKLVKREEVFPVCGLWALHAHLVLRYKERDEISCNAVEEAYKKIPEFLKLESSNNKALSVLEASAFEELEKKLKCSIETTDFQMWNDIVYKQCIQLLEGPIQAAGTTLHIIESKINNSLKNIEKIKVKIETLKDLEVGTQKFALEELEEEIQQRSSGFFRRKVSPILEEKMGQFCGSCIDNVSKNNYTHGQFKKDWELFSNQDLSNAFTQELNFEAKRCLENYTCQVSEKYNKMIRHILEYDPHNTTFNVEAEVQEVKSRSVGVLEGIRNFFRFIFLSERTKKKQLRNVISVITNVGKCVAMGTGALVIGIAVAPRSLPLTVVPFVVAGVQITYWANKAKYHYDEAINATSDNEILSQTDVSMMCDRMKDEITSNFAPKIEQDLENALQKTLKDYNQSLKAEYNSKWGCKLKKELEEAQRSLLIIQKEKEGLTEALDKLKKYSEDLVKETE